MRVTEFKKKKKITWRKKKRRHLHTNNVYSGIRKRARGKEIKR